MNSVTNRMMHSLSSIPYGSHSARMTASARSATGLEPLKWTRSSQVSAWINISFHEINSKNECNKPNRYCISLAHFSIENVRLCTHNAIYANFFYLLFLIDKYTSQFGTGSQYAYYHDEDETTFHLVDTARVQKPPYQRGRFRGNLRQR